MTELSEETAYELRERRRQCAQEQVLEARIAADVAALPLPLTGLVAIPLGPEDDFPPGEPAAASGQTDDKQTKKKESN